MSLLIMHYVTPSIGEFWHLQNYNSLDSKSHLESRIECQCLLVKNVMNIIDASKMQHLSAHSHDLLQNMKAAV